MNKSRYFKKDSKHLGKALHTVHIPKRAKRPLTREEMNSVYELMASVSATLDILMDLEETSLFQKDFKKHTNLYLTYLYKMQGLFFEKIESDKIKKEQGAKVVHDMIDQYNDMGATFREVMRHIFRVNPKNMEKFAKYLEIGFDTYSDNSNPNK